MTPSGIVGQYPLNACHLGLHEQGSSGSRSGFRLEILQLTFIPREPSFTLRMQAVTRCSPGSSPLSSVTARAPAGRCCCWAASWGRWRRSTPSVTSTSIRTAKLCFLRTRCFARTSRHTIRRFPQQNNLIVIVVDGATAEQADIAAGRLAAALAPDTNHFTSVRRPDGGPFFAHEGLLLLPLATVRKTADALIHAQPFLGGFAADPSLRGVMKTLHTTLLGVTSGQTGLASLDRPIAAFDATLAGVLAGKPSFFGWSSLVTGTGDLAGKRRFVEVQPKLDYASLLPGARPTRAIRTTAKRLGLRTAASGVRVRLTGPVPMADEEFASITDHGALLGSLMLLATLVMLWLALRSVRMILAVVATIVIGLALTAAIGLLAYGEFNVISVAFVVLFVGLGVDFGIQFCVRYRAERHRLGNLREALAYAGICTGTGLTLAAAAAALSFYSFLPTHYAGLAQLGHDRRHRHDHHVCAQYHRAARVPAAAAADGGGRRNRLPRTEAAGRLCHEQLPPRAADRSSGGRDCTRALPLAAVRFQSARPAQSALRIGGDSAGAGEEHRDLAKHDQCAAPFAGGRRRSRADSNWAGCRACRRR